MNAEGQEFIEFFKTRIKIKLEPGETCPCCGQRKSKRNVSEKMRQANRQNIKLAHEARWKTKKEA
jgi:hypothetical protein